jgi:hypothetical protein
VIENEADCGTRFHHGDRNRKLAIEHAKIERKPVLFKTSNIFSKERGLPQVIRLRIQNSPVSLQFAVSRNLIKVSCKLVSLGATAGNNPCDSGISIRQGQQVSGFRRDVRFVDVCFHQDDCRNFYVTRGVVIFFNQKLRFNSGTAFVHE